MLRLNFINKPKLTSPFKSNLNESDRLRGFSATHTHTQVCSQIFISTAKDGTRQGGGGGVCVCPSWWAQTAGRDGTDREENTWTVHSVKLGADSQARRAASEYTHTHTHSKVQSQRGPD